MIAILGDIHGNLPALEAVLENMPVVSQVWAVGDYVTGVPFPGEVIDRLQNLPVPVYSVLGNHDESLLNKRGGVYGKQFGIFGWVEEVLKPHHWAFLENLPKTLVIDNLPLNRNALLFHGTPESTTGTIITRQDAEDVMAAHDFAYLAGGHRHKIIRIRKENQYVIVAGSVGISLDGSGGQASYALLDEKTGKAAFQIIDYDVDSAIAAIDKSPITELAPGISYCVKKELETGKPYMMSFVKFAFELAEKQLGYRPDEVPSELWDEAGKMWDKSPL